MLVLTKPPIEVSKKSNFKRSEIGQGGSGQRWSGIAQKCVGHCWGQDLQHHTDHMTLQFLRTKITLQFLRKKVETSHVVSVRLDARQKFEKSDTVAKHIKVGWMPRPGEKMGQCHMSEAGESDALRPVERDILLCHGTYIMRL